MEEPKVLYRDHNGRYYVNSKGERIYPDTPDKQLYNVSREEFNELKKQVEDMKSVTDRHILYKGSID